MTTISLQTYHIIIQPLYYSDLFGAFPLPEKATIDIFHGPDIVLGLYARYLSLSHPERIKDDPTDDQNESSLQLLPISHLLLMSCDVQNQSREYG